MATFGLHFRVESFLSLLATFWAIFGENWAIFCFSILATLSTTVKTWNAFNDWLHLMA
jgi:hypothetical protein